MPIESAKAGSSYLVYDFKRGRGGLAITVKAHRDIEEFFAKHSNGATGPMAAYGRYWEATEPEREMPIYNVYEEFTPNRAYFLDGVAEPLIRPNDGKINLSFLRLAGISEPEGVTFVVRGMFSLAGTNEISARIIEASGIFVREYIAPFDICLAVVGKSIT